MIGCLERRIGPQDGRIQWSITMVRLISPVSGSGFFGTPSIHGLFIESIINGGDPNHLVTGMILKVQMGDLEGVPQPDP